MVIMESYYPQNRLQDVWQSINKLHLSYLELEESAEKLDYRQRLEDCIRDFLYMVAHSQKFYFQATGEVLTTSAVNKRDFSGYKACTGWNAIQMYAGNLLSQPWRQEYREIKTYSGFYKHQIEANLMGGELMFEAMGYKPTGNGVLVLDGPICPDLVTNVSRDCLVAYVECQIIKTIWEEISPSFTISWWEVLEARQLNAANLEQTIKLLTYSQQTKHFNNRLTYQPVPAQYFGGASSNVCCSNYATYAAPPMANNFHYATLPHYHVPPVQTNLKNGYSSFPVYEQQPNRLIDFDDGARVNGNLDTVDSVTSKSAKNSGQQLENWDYVYRDLESQGYTKDLGERGDLLKRTKQTNLDEAMLSLKMRKELSDTSSYENVAEGAKKLKGTTSKGTTQKRTLNDAPIQSDKKREAIIQQSEKFIQKEKNGNTNENQNGNRMSKIEEWHCKACTYLNTKSNDICEICSKSRTGKIESKLEPGGPQCSKCTLVNSKDTKVCTVCGTSLKNSPTYI